MLEGAHVVLVEVHGLFGSARLLLDLRAEAFRLIDRIVELTERVADLTPMNEELEAVDELGMAIVFS